MLCIRQHTFGRNFRNYEFNNVEYSADVMLNNPRYEFKWFWMFISFSVHKKCLTFFPEQVEQKTIRHILTSTTCASCVEVVNSLQKMHENGRLALREFRRSKNPKKIRIFNFGRGQGPRDGRDSWQCVRNSTDNHCILVWLDPGISLSLLNSITLFNIFVDVSYVARSLSFLCGNISRQACFAYLDDLLFNVGTFRILFWPFYHVIDIASWTNLPRQWLLWHNNSPGKEMWVFFQLLRCFHRRFYR